MKILFLNLAGPYETATDNSITGLRAKYTGRDSFFSKLFYGASEVLRVDLDEVYQEVYAYLEASSTSDTGTPKFDEAKRGIDRFLNANPGAKLMLSIHGLVDDVTHGICKYALGKELKISYLRLYDFFMMLVEDRYRATDVKLTLVMCYGARAAAFEKLHTYAALTSSDRPDLKTSFAYAFYALICKRMRVTMTARTGALSFDSGTGQSKVESERLIAIKALEKSLASESQDSDPSVMELYGTSMEADQLLDDLFAEKQVALEDVDELGLGKVPTRVLKTTVARYTVQRVKERETKSKYGKLVYTYDRSGRRIEIRCKYDDDGNKVDEVVARGIV